MASNDNRGQVPGPLEVQVPKPLEAPSLFEVPYSVGASAMNSDASIESAEERKEWLQGQGADVALVVATRAALRALPAFSLASGPTGSRATRRRTLLRVFRALATTWSASAFLATREVQRGVARKTALGLADLQLSATERSAAYALAALAAESNVTAERAATAVEYALDAAGAAGKTAFDLMLEAIRTDAALLDQGFSPEALAGLKLWRETPDWARELWDELKGNLWAENEGWEVWTHWYDARLSGELSPRQIELRWTAIPNDEWEEHVGSVNRRLLELAEMGGSETSHEAGISEPTDSQTSQSGTLHSVQAVGRAGTILGQVSVSATAEVIPNPAVEAVVSRIKSDPRQFESIARYAARSIEQELKHLASKIPNEPAALAGYEEVRAVLQRLQSGFEDLAGAVHDSIETSDPIDQTNLLRKAVRAAHSMSEGFVGWLDENGTKAGRVIAELGLAGIISGTLSYFVGIPPLVSFSVTVAALNGKSVWEAIALFAPKAKGGKKGDWGEYKSAIQRDDDRARII
jgi:hypothetical protein